MTQTRFELNEYTLRVLDVVKGKYGLKNRSDALNQFALEYGQDLVALPTNEKILREVDERANTYWKKYEDKKMTLKELEQHLGL